MKSITITLTKEEREWVAHAARLCRVSLREYVIQAINTRLRREGVDAVLIKEQDDLL